MMVVVLDLRRPSMVLFAVAFCCWLSERFRFDCGGEFFGAYFTFFLD